MQKEKLLLAMDYNNLAHRSLYSSKYGSEFVTSFDTDKECAVFARYLIKDIINLTKLFSPSEVYLLTDAKDPWRKELLPEYKATRKKDETVNFDNVYRTMREVYEVLERYGFCPLSVQHAEADDLASMLRAIIRPEGSNIVYISSDADWRQLIEFDADTKRFVNVYNPFINGARGIRTMYVGKGFVDWMSSKDFFGAKNASSKFLIEHAIQQEKTLRLEEVDASDILLTKILCGDDSDNVPSFHEFLSGKGKRVRITETKKTKLLEGCSNPTSVSELRECINNGILKTSFKETLKWNVDELDLSTILERQRKYVELNPSLFPMSIRSGFVDKMRSIDRGAITINQSVLNSYAIIENSKFKNSNDIKNGARVNSIFNGLNTLGTIRKPSDL